MFWVPLPPARHSQRGDRLLAGATDREYPVQARQCQRPHHRAPVGDQHQADNDSALTGHRRLHRQHAVGETKTRAGVDASGTRQNNLFKYTAGLNPTNPASVFWMQMGFLSNQPNLSFGPVWSNRLYNVQSKTDLLSGNWIDLTGPTAPAGNGSQVTITDTNPLSSARFYRVGISYP